MPQSSKPMKIFKKLRTLFCIHQWIPLKVINMEIYNEYDIRYARCKCACRKCNKIQYNDYMLKNEYQDRLNSEK